jgi:tetratricopeptide (TPR) repeat protein
MFKGICYSSLEKYENAIIYFDLLIQMNANDTDAINQKAHCLFDLNHYEDAIKCYQQVIKLNQLDSSAY